MAPQLSPFTLDEVTALIRQQLTEFGWLPGEDAIPEFRRARETALESLLAAANLSEMVERVNRLNENFAIGREISHFSTIHSIQERKLNLGPGGGFESLMEILNHEKGVQALVTGIKEVARQLSTLPVVGQVMKTPEALKEGSFSRHNLVRMLAANNLEVPSKGLLAHSDLLRRVEQQTPEGKAKRDFWDIVIDIHLASDSITKAGMRARIEDGYALKHKAARAAALKAARAAALGVAESMGFLEESPDWGKLRSYSTDDMLEAVDRKVEQARQASSGDPGPKFSAKDVARHTIINHVRDALPGLPSVEIDKSMDISVGLDRRNISSPESVVRARRILQETQERGPVIFTPTEQDATLKSDSIEEWAWEIAKESGVLDVPRLMIHRELEEVKFALKQTEYFILSDEENAEIEAILEQRVREDALLREKIKEENRQAREENRRVMESIGEGGSLYRFREVLLDPQASLLLLKEFAQQKRAADAVVVRSAQTPVWDKPESLSYQVLQGIPEKDRKWALETMKRMFDILYSEKRVKPALDIVATQSIDPEASIQDFPSAMEARRQASRIGGKWKELGRQWILAAARYPDTTPLPSSHLLEVKETGRFIPTKEEIFKVQLQSAMKRYDIASAEEEFRVSVFKEGMRIRKQALEAGNTAPSSASPAHQTQFQSIAASAHGVLSRLRQQRQSKENKPGIPEPKDVKNGLG